MSKEHQPLIDWANKGIDSMNALNAALAPGYESPGLDGDEANRLALELLRQFDGQPLSVVRQVLRQAEFWLGAVTTLDCGPSTEFARASAAHQAAFERSA